MRPTFADIAALGIRFRAETAFAGVLETAIWLAEIVADSPVGKASCGQADRHVTLGIDKGVAAVRRNSPRIRRYRLVPGRRETSRRLPALDGTLGLEYIEESR